MVNLGELMHGSIITVAASTHQKAPGEPRIRLRLRGFHLNFEFPWTFIT